jgi:phosphoserine phosphatase RsbU/P
MRAMASMRFIPTDGNPRLAIADELARLIKDDMSSQQAFQALLAAMRRMFGNANCFVEVNTTGLPDGGFRLTRVWNEAGAELVPNHSLWRFEGVPVRTGGAMAEILARKSPCAVADATIDSSDPIYPELGIYHSFVAVPGGLGDPSNWAVLCSREREAYNTEFLENSVLRVALISTALKNIQALQDLRRANMFIDSELDRIAAIQQALLPEAAPRVPGMEIAASSQTFDRVGGDLYDYAEIETGSWALLIADASGHGPSAAVVAAMLHAILHAFPDTVQAMEMAAGKSEVHPMMPGRVLKFANAHLWDKRIEQSFVTAFLAGWDPKQRTLTYARAGHNPPLLCRQGTVTELNRVGGIPLAIMPDSDYEQAVQPLQTGDVVLMFTDGVSDAENSAGQQFGEDRLHTALISAIKGNATANQILATLSETLATYCRGVHSRDDQTLVVLRIV